MKQLAYRISWALAVLGALALTYCAVTLVSAEFRRADEEQKLAQRIRMNVDSQAAVKEEVLLRPSEGSAIGRLVIPRIGLSTIIIEGSGSADLEVAAGHVPGTALPGERGNIAIAGHRDTSFRALRLIRKGDALSLIARGGTYSYRVVSTAIVEPSDIQVLYPTLRDTLTIVTCYPFYFVGSAPNRFVVRAERIAGDAGHD